MLCDYCRNNLGLSYLRILAPGAWDICMCNECFQDQNDGDVGGIIVMRINQESTLLEPIQSFMEKLNHV